MRLARHVLVLGSLAAAAAAGAQGADEPYVEKVEVRVRTVLVFITDARGRPLTTRPAPTDLRVTENGKPAEVLAIERARPTAVPAAPAPGATVAPAPSSTASAPTLAVVPQYLYLDTTTLRLQSVPRIVKTLGNHLDAVLANGPLEVVVADPEPRVTLPSTRDAAAVRATLEKLPTTAVGKQRVYDARRDSLNQMLETLNDPRRGGSAFRVDSRGAIRQEMALVQASLDRLDSWAATLPYDRASVVYLCSDGFDGDLTEVYRKILRDSTRFEDHRTADQLQLDFGRSAANVTAQAADVLAGRGATAVVLAFSGNDADFALSAANIGKYGSRTIRQPLVAAPTSYFLRPFEPLLAIADRTGGQVVSAESKMSEALDAVGRAYLVSFRSHSPADGEPHPLEIASASGDLRVRAPRSVLAATPRTASAGQAVRALTIPPPAAGSLPVTATVTPLEKLEKGRTKGALAVSADLVSIADALGRTGPGRVRITVAVENPNGPPFTQSEETELDHSGGGTIWYYESAIVWPSNATRVAVTVEELKTGTAGSAVAELPKP